MLFAEAGMIFGVPQNNNSVLHDSFMFLFPQLSPITFKWSEHGAVFFRERECKTWSGSRAE